MQTHYADQCQNIHFIPQNTSIWGKFKEVATATAKMIPTCIKRDRHKHVLDLNDHLLRDIGMTDSAGNRPNELDLRQKFTHPYL